MTIEPPQGLKSNMLRAFGSGGTGLIGDLSPSILSVLRLFFFVTQMTVEPPQGLKSNILRAFGSGGTGVIGDPSPSVLSVL